MDEIKQIRELRYLPDYIPNTSIYSTSIPTDTDARSIQDIYFDFQDKIGWQDGTFLTHRVELPNGRIIWVVRQL